MRPIHVTVVPAKAGTQRLCTPRPRHWAPAFAGATDRSGWPCAERRAVQNTGYSGLAMTTLRSRRRTRFAQQRKLQVFQAGQIALQLLDLFAERMHVFELAIDGCKAHVRHLVEFLELAHHQFADVA